MMTIVLNGQPRALGRAMSVADLLADLAIDPRIVAVEVDRVVVRRDRFASTALAPGSEVEIVSFVGGGHPLAGESTDALQ